MSKITVELPAELAAFLERQVEAGVYNSVADAIQDAVRSQYEDDDNRLEALRAALAPGLADIAAGRVSEITLQELLAEARATARAAE